MQIDLAAIYMAGWTNPILRIQSVTDGEAFDVFTSDLAGVLGSPIVIGSTMNDSFLSVPLAFNHRFLGVAVHYRRQPDDNVLLDAFSADPPPSNVPEPATYALLGTGLFLVVPVTRRRKRKNEQREMR